MPVTREYTVHLKDRAGTLGKVCRALADRGVNILALHSHQGGAKSVTRFIVDNPEAAKAVFDAEKLTHSQTDVLLLKLPHRPGEIARVASRLGEADININYAYCGLEAGTNTPLVFFGVAEVARAAKLLDEPSAAAASTRS